MNSRVHVSLTTPSLTPHPQGFPSIPNLILALLSCPYVKDTLNVSKIISPHER
jgi:hypothetical protein